MCPVQCVTYVSGRSGEEIGPARPHVAGHVFDDDGDGIRFRIEGGEQAGVGTLLDGAITQTFVIAQKIAGIFGVRGGKLVCHGIILYVHAAEFNG